MNDIPRIPWGKVFSNFVWIVGVSLIFANLCYHEFLAHLQKAKRKKLFKRNSFKRPLFLGLILITVGICTSSLLQIFSAKPEGIILKDMVELLPSSLGGYKIKDGLLMTPWYYIIKSKKIQFEKAKYEVRIVSKSNKVLGKTAQLKVYLGINLIADYFTSTEYIEKIIEFNSNKKKIKSLLIEFANTYYDIEKKLYSNVWIKSITISKMDNDPK